MIVEDPKTGDVSLPGATLVEIRDHKSFEQLLHLGGTHRFAANTKLNTESSRSHAILMVKKAWFYFMFCAIYCTTLNLVSESLDLTCVCCIAGTH